MMSQSTKKKTKIPLLWKVALMALVISGVYDLYYVYYALPRFEVMAVDGQEAKGTERVEVATGMLESYYYLETSGAATRDQAQSLAIEALGAVQYDADQGEGPFWATDDAGVLLLDASRPELVNTYVGDLRDGEGNLVFRTAEALAGSGSEASYRVSQPREEGGGTEDATACVASFEHWGWAVGTGISFREAMGPYNSMRNEIGIVFGAVGVCIILGVWVAVSQLYSKPVKSLVRTSEALAEGDVEQRIDIKSNDELGELGAAYSGVVDYLKEMAAVSQRIAGGDLTVEVKPRSERDALGHAMRQMTDRQRELIAKVKGTAVSVSEASKQLSKAAEQTAQATQQITATIQQVARGAGEQSTSLQQTASSMDQLTRAIEQIAGGSQEQARAVDDAARVVEMVSVAIATVSDNAGAGAQEWENTAESAVGGARKTHETVAGMERIKKAMDLVSDKVTDLGDRSGEIGKIVATIDDIAAQTNLLALNAAIEAARAGDQGRGFAVVADEVRKLAERSSVATKEIATLVNGTQAGVREAVNAMQQGSREVEEGYKLAADAGAALDDILTRSQSVRKQVTEISVAAHALKDLGREMTETIHKINKIVEENAAATQEMTASSGVVSTNIETTAGVAEENSAASEQVSASTEEMSAQVEEALAAAQSLSEMSEEMERTVAFFKTNRDAGA
jgi:methyl-accepting chemotaxis protein